MEFSYRGANCVQIATKGGVLITDPNIELVGLKDSFSAKADVCLLTQEQFRPTAAIKAFMIDTPGEYELKEFAIQGMVVRAYNDAADAHTAIAYRVYIGTTNILIVGHMYPSLSEAQLEEIGTVDIIIIPVGGGGYTIDAAQASKLVRLVSPRVVIPTHFAESGVKYPIEQGGLEEFTKDLGVTPEVVEKYKIKGDSLPENLTLVQLKRF